VIDVVFDGVEQPDVAEDEGVFTSAGVSAGIDLAPAPV
jgi:transcriptional regulator GlxA family with amidase domain